MRRCALQSPMMRAVVAFFGCRTGRIVPGPTP